MKIILALALTFLTSCSLSKTEAVKLGARAYDEKEWSEFVNSLAIVAYISHTSEGTRLVVKPRTGIFSGDASWIHNHRSHYNWWELTELTNEANKESVETLIRK